MPDTETAPAADAPKGRRTFGLRALVGVALICSLAAGTVGFFLAQLRAAHGFGGFSQAASGHAESYQCPMHPTIVEDHPANCPICGMKLVKVDSRKLNATAPRNDSLGIAGSVSHIDTAVNDEPTVEGLAPVDIDPTRQQLIGLRTANVTLGKVGGSWRTVGRVVVDETRVHHVNIKVAGFVEHVHVDFIGKQVFRGTPLFSMYSPELLAAQDEYLLALKTRGVLNSASPSPSGENDILVNAARRKLALWDVSDEALEGLTQTGHATKTITVYSPAAGVVTKKDVVHGMKLEAGAMPYEIVDLSSVWVAADVYESELRFIKVGMPATLTLNAFPDREFNGKTVFIDPMLDPMTRTVKVRLTFPNPTKELKPEMFGEVVIKGSPHEALTIPADAVIDSGTSHVVFVALGAGKFQPRTVRLGTSDGSLVEVVAGLKRGESIVTRANFLIDSESRLRASLAALTQGVLPTQPQSARVLPATDSMPAPVAPSNSAALQVPRSPRDVDVRPAPSSLGAHGK